MIFLLPLENGQKKMHRQQALPLCVLYYIHNELVERSFAIRRYAQKGIKITEVRRRATGNNETYIKNLLHSMFGYIPVFEREDRYSKGYWAYKVFDKTDFDRWYIANVPCNFHCIYLNAEILKDINEFKWCGYSEGDIITWLNEYRQNHKLEFFGKLGIPISHLLMNYAQKDKAFRSFLSKEAKSVRAYGPKATVYAYKRSISIHQAYKELNERRIAFRRISGLRGTDVDVLRIIDYCDEKNINYSIYNDYINAVVGLGLNLKDTKNLYPINFLAMHDLRINEYEALKAKKDKQKRKALYKAFAVAGQKAVGYEFEQDNFLMIAPREIPDLMREGKILGHCVGKMGYDKKMADGDIVIMFVRQKADKETPFVTIEYDLQRKNIRQAYGKSNSTPGADVMDFIRAWEMKMKKDFLEESVV